MPSVAEQLRLAREKQHLSVYDVAEATKIRTDHVRALEDGKYEIFAAPIYIRGFVRSYAAFLKLDVAGVMRDLDAELSANNRSAGAAHRGPLQQSTLDLFMLQIAKLNWLWVAITLVLALVLTAAVVGYRAWRNHQTADPLTHLGSGTYEPARTNAGDILPLPAGRTD